MDDVNINEICLGIEEVELDGEEEEWIKLSWHNSQSDDDGNFQSPEIQKDSNNDMVQMKNCDNKVSFTNAEPEDISDGISVITESDTETVNTNLFQICQFKPLNSPQMLEVQMNRQKNIWNILTACIFGIIIGLVLSHFFTIPETYPVSGEVDAESLRAASHNIVDTCKELTNVKTMLNEIKAHIPIDKKITKELLEQFLEIIDSSNKTSRKPIIVTKKFSNSASHPLDQLQESLHVLSSLVYIHDDNSSLKNEINKTLDIVNNTKVFYDTLILFTNNTQNNPIALNLLQYSNNKIHITSKLLLFNLKEKVSKVTSKVYNKYAKERYKLNKILCHLKSKSPDDKFLKQLTENNQLFKDYEKSCFLNYGSKNLDNKMTKENTKIKERITKTHDTNLKYDKKNIHIIQDNNKENKKENKRNKRQNISKSATKFIQDTGHKIHNISQLLLSKVIENVSKLRRQLNKKLHHLKNMLPANSEILKQLTKDDERDIKESIKFYEKKNDYLQSNISKNNYDNILMQLKNTCPLSNNYCPKFNINMNAKKIINDKANYGEGKNTPSQNKIKSHKISEHIVNYHKHSSFDSHTMKQDNQQYANTDQRSVSKSRPYEYKKFDDSNWFFQRAHSRRNARKRAEYIYQRNTKWF